MTTTPLAIHARQSGRALTTLRLLTAALILALGMVVLAACGGDDDDDAAGDANGGATTTSGGTESKVMGAIITPPLEKPNFVLTDTNNKPYDIKKETEGYLTLLYLGYTHCPDVCPTHMADMATVIKKLPADVSSKIKVLFITTDPARDTPEVLGNYVHLFHPDFIGLTGPEDQIISLQKTLGVNPATKTDLGGGNYAVNHAAYVMAFTAPDNVAHTVYPLGVTREDWENDLKLLVQEGWKP